MFANKKVNQQTMSGSCCGQDSDPQFPADKHTEWMARLPESLRNEPISKIAIPGTHDSFAFNLTKTPGPDLSDGLKRFIPVIGVFIKRWSLTQKLTFAEQLQIGLRYFDMRVCRMANKSSDRVEDQFYFTHGLLGSLVVDGLREINQFLDQHSKEIILLDFNHFYEFKQDSDHDDLIQMIHGIFGAKLCTTARTITECTFNHLWTNQQQVVLLYEREPEKCTAYMDRVGHFFKTCQSPWPNKTSVDELFEYLDKNVATSRPIHCINVVQGQITPDDKSIRSSPLGSLQSAAQPVNRRLMEWLKSRHRDPSRANGVNVVICDFANPEFVDTIVMLNSKDLGPVTTPIS